MLPRTKKTYNSRLAKPHRVNLIGARKAARIAAAARTRGRADRQRPVRACARAAARRTWPATSNYAMHNRFRPFLVPSAVAIATVLSACSSAPKPLYQQEQFDATASPYARTFHEKSAATCEAARRALLSQGYMASATRADAIEGSKNFQPSNDSHVVIEFHVVCADADADGTSSIAYVNAVQDRYSLKKSNTSASVGLSVFGSLSLPIGSSDDAMVKIASETIPAGVFYERFFNLVDHFLKIDPTRRDKAAVKAAEKERVAPLPEPEETAEGAPMKMKTPAVPTPPAQPVQPVHPAEADGASAASAAASASATPAAASAPAQKPAPASAASASSSSSSLSSASASAPAAAASTPTASPAPASAPAPASSPSSSPSPSPSPSSAPAPASAPASTPETSHPSSIAPPTAPVASAHQPAYRPAYRPARQPATSASLDAPLPVAPPPLMPLMPLMPLSTPSPGAQPPANAAQAASPTATLAPTPTTTAATAAAVTAATTTTASASAPATANAATTEAATQSNANGVDAR